MVEILGLDQVSFISANHQTLIDNAIERVLEAFTQINDTDITVTQPSYSQFNCYDQQDTSLPNKLYKSKSVDSQFRKRCRRKGSLTLSKSSITSHTTLINDRHALSPDDETSVRFKRIHDGSRDKGLLLASDKNLLRTNKSLIAEVREQKEEKPTYSWRRSTFNKIRAVNEYFAKHNTNDVDNNVQTDISRDNNGMPISKEQILNVSGKDKSQSQGSLTQNLENVLRGELSDEKVVPLPKSLFSLTDRNGLEGHHQIQMTVLTSKHKMSSTRSKKSIRNMLKALLWKTCPANESAEIENKIFSPGTHRPSTCDVPGIYEIESEEENIDDEDIQTRKTERSRSQSTIGVLFGSVSDCASDSKELPSPLTASTEELQTMISSSQLEPTGVPQNFTDIKASPILKKKSIFSRRYRMLRPTSPSFRVRFLSPTSSE